MPALQHTYITAHGEWSSSAWLGEFAQFGLRVCYAQGDSEPDKGSIFTPMANGDVTADSGTATGTHGTLTRTWKARIGAVASTDNADAGAQIDMAEDVWTYLSNLTTVQDADFRWTHVKLAPILADGTYGAPSAIYDFTTNIPGTASASLNCAPPELSIAVSLRAPIIGRRGRGRIYVPGLSTAAIAADGTANSGYYTNLAGGLVTLIGDLENVTGIDTHTPIVSVGSAGSSTFVRPSQVRIGNHFDVQRRRQHQVPETYTTTAL